MFLFVKRANQFPEFFKIPGFYQFEHAPHPRFGCTIRYPLFGNPHWASGGVSAAGHSGKRHMFVKEHSGIYKELSDN